MKKGGTNLVNGRAPSRNCVTLGNRKSGYEEGGMGMMGIEEVSTGKKCSTSRGF
jgi:hypothetical protein